MEDARGNSSIHYDVDDDDDDDNVVTKTSVNSLQKVNNATATLKSNRRPKSPTLKPLNHQATHKPKHR